MYFPFPSFALSPGIHAGSPITASKSQSSKTSAISPYVCYNVLMQQPQEQGDKDTTTVQGNPSVSQLNSCAHMPYVAF